MGWDFCCLLCSSYVTKTGTNSSTIYLSCVCCAGLHPHQWQGRNRQEGVQCSGSFVHSLLSAST
jgi:hypothetical protein